DFGRGWDCFWFAPSDPTTLGLMRLLGGLVLFYSYFCYSFDLMSYVSPQKAWLDAEATQELRYNSPVVMFPDDWTSRPVMAGKGHPNLVVPLQPLSSATFVTRLFQIQFCFIYLAAGTSKLLGASWWNGNALWGCYANYQFAPMRVPLYQDFLVFLCQHRWLWE